MTQFILSKNLVVKIEDANHIAFVTIPDDPQLKETGVSFTSEFWSNLAAKFDLLTAQLQGRVLDQKINIYQQKYGQVINTSRYGDLVMLQTFTRAGNEFYKGSVRFTKEEWYKLAEYKDIITQIYIQKENEKKLVTVKEKKALMYTWTWNDKCSNAAYFTKEQARQNACSEPDILSDEDNLVIKGEFVIPYSYTDFIQYAYCFLLNKTAAKMQEKEGGANYLEYLQKASVHPDWIGMFFTQFFMMQGLPPAVKSAEALKCLLAYVNRDILLDQAYELEADISPFYLLCLDLYEDIGELPSAVY